MLESMKRSWILFGISLFAACDPGLKDGQDPLSPGNPPGGGEIGDPPDGDVPSDAPSEPSDGQPPPSDAPNPPSDAPNPPSDAPAPPVDACPGATPTPGTGEPSSLAGIVLKHNEVRATVSQCNPLPNLIWKQALADTAAAWIAQCKDTDGNGLIDHNPNRGAGHPYQVGENVFGTSGNASSGTAAQAVKLWADEVVDYDYDSNSCAPGRVCGHYTQIVWRKTLEVGCAIGVCSNMRFKTSVVCNYGPAGNFIGQRPY